MEVAKANSKEVKTVSDNSNRGYTKEEYYQISKKQRLPKRCPILGNCCRAIETRYEMGMIGSSMSFKEFIHSYGSKWDNMIQSIEQISRSHVPDVFTSVENVCPEVTLFEDEYLPFNFRQSAFGSASYYKESRSFEAEEKHYSECTEFSEYLFHSGKTVQKNRKRSPISKTMRIEIFQRDGFRCHYCKRHKDELPKGVSLELDHKVPYADGGNDSFENLVTACSCCNRGKSNKVI